jgi:hypothetical protein
MPGTDISRKMKRDELMFNHEMGLKYQGGRGMSNRDMALCSVLCQEALAR